MVTFQEHLIQVEQTDEDLAAVHERRAVVERTISTPVYGVAVAVADEEDLPVQLAPMQELPLPELEAWGRGLP